jgi:hypothetical protein
MIRVTPRARRHHDTAGDPLDGLVNLFDLGIVLAVAFLLAALAAVRVGIGDGRLTSPATTPSNGVTVRPDQTSGVVPTDGATVIGDGTEVGKVYRLADGQLVYVVPTASASGTAGTPR